MSPDELRRLLAARELVVAHLLDDALAAFLLALTLEHPTLEQLPAPGAPPTLRSARTLARLARHLRKALVRYERTVDDALAPPPTDEDLPF